MTADWQSALARAQAHAPFLALALRRRPELAELLAEGRGEEALAAARRSGERVEDIGEALRIERLSHALVLAIGDLAGAFPLDQVLSELTGFADSALDRAMRAVVARRCPDAEFAGFTALALGKQGAGELNYSSDIDPILLYDPATLPRRERDDPGEAAQRYSRQLVELLSSHTGEGYVMRVDLRLRPAAEVSPLAISFPTALSHYESSALAWERAAYIRARAAAGDIAAGEHFLEEVRPFVWRRSLDFTAIEEIRRLTARIREAYPGPREPGAGFDVKRGRGGIREVEFFAQTHQLIYGGRLPSLRLRGTRAALDALAGEGIITAQTAQELGEAYDRLRVVEHRLQMVEDRQTHELPGGGEALDNVARLDGLEDGAALLEELRAICARVGEHYDGLLSEGDDGSSGGVAVPAQFRADFDARVAHWTGSLRVMRSAGAQQAFAVIRPRLLEALAEAPDPARAMARWETLLERLPTAINLFRLFEQRPGLLDTVLRVLTLTQPLADELARRPELLDALIDASALDLPGSVDDLAEAMRQCEEPDYETRLGRIRQVVGEERFALGVQLIDCRHDPLAIAEGLCRVAEGAVRTGAEAAIEEFEQVHGKIADSELIILGLGRLGGGALTHASDLDVVYLFTGDIGEESDGRRPLSTSLYFNRLATRVTAALSVPTAEGALYEIDTRLRPQGRNGPLAVSVESFARYQASEAWTWEHMALARARPIFGSAEGKEHLQQAIREVLLAPRDPETLRADVLKMRGDVATHKPPRGDLDVKLMRGGLMDSEFLIHYLQLRHGLGFVPALESAIGELVAADHLPPDYAEHHLALTRVLVAARLLAPGSNESTPPASAVLARACGADDLPALRRAIIASRQAIAAQWAEVFDEKLEIE
ncbi:glutamine-synthetase adenylyltransferase [Aurantiacibacter suaedae]|uniref:[protein-PII] uridylyltransferase family protein n=1 Tax=Aurantiacibacter suaedae TaxID=2545755 RepID=UPI0010F5F795|nr:glutamine-synthetase adenylyltransferase [Aurantiacibacter suaedae]